MFGCIIKKRIKICLVLISYKSGNNENDFVIKVGEAPLLMSYGDLILKTWKIIGLSSARAS